MTGVRLILFALIGFGMSGCATTEPQLPDVKSSVERLSPRDLSPGECGLFVWTGDVERRFILFSQASKFSGAWLTDHSETQLKITDQKGESANRQFPDVGYMSAGGIALKLSLENREPIINGTRFKSGTLTVAGKDGWETVQPIVGLTACQPT